MYLWNQADMYTAVVLSGHSEMEELTESLNERHALNIPYGASKLQIVSILMNVHVYKSFGILRTQSAI